MEVPIGFLAKLWSFISFLPIFFLLLILGLLKGLVICPVVGCIIGIGNSAVIIGLWPAHIIWTCYCLAKTKRLGLVLKVLVLIVLPVPLALWLVLGIVCSILGGIAYGFFAPLVATFESVGEAIAEKFVHHLIDGCWSTIEGSLTVVRDFTDFCFHSYFSYMDELSEEIRQDEHPIDIKLSRLPSCLLAILVGVPVDTVLITVVAFWKSPYMLVRGWKRLLEDLIGREGPFLETVCVPFAALAIILWPIAVAGAVICSFFVSFSLGLYSGVVVHQENSLQMGLAYIVAIVSQFDEYTNDMLFLREGSCFPRPTYRTNTSPDPTDGLERKQSSGIDRKISRDGSYNLKLVSERSRTLKSAILQYTPIHIWDWLFKACEVNGRTLLHEGLINVRDIEECMVKGRSKKLEIRLPAWSILKCLLASAKSDSSGLVISEDMELTRMNWPRDKVFQWFMGPLFVMKEQLKGLNLTEEEEMCLKKLIMQGNNDKPEDWDDTGFPSDDMIRRAQLQAVIRRLQGIVGSMSRMPTFRRRFRNMVKALCAEAIQYGILNSDVGDKVATRNGVRNSGDDEESKDREMDAAEKGEHKMDNRDVIRTVKST